MAFSMDAARLAPTRTVCDVCEAVSTASRGSVCRTCAVGTMCWFTELQVRRAERAAARRAQAQA